MRFVRVMLVTALVVGGVAAVVPEASANTGAIVPNGSKVTASITGPADSAVFTFSGSSGDVVNVTASGGTFTNACDVSLQVDDAFGRALSGPVCSGTSTFLGSITLPGTAGYVLKLTPNNNDTGSVQLQLSKNAAAGGIAVNGAGVTFTATHPGQGRNYSFAGSAGDVVNLSTANGTYAGNCDVEFAIVDNHSRTINGPGCGADSSFVGSVTLPGTGTYLLEVIPTNGNTGSVQLQLSRNAADAAITVNGPAVTFTASRPGQGRNYSFAGTDGDVVNLSAANGTYAGNCDVLMAIVDSHNRTLVGPACAGDSSFLGSVTLPGTGTYLVEVLPGASHTGHVQLRISKDLANATIAVNGAVTFSATRPGQGRNYSFTGTDGDVVNLSAANGTYAGNCDVEMAIVDSHNRTLAGPACSGDSSFLGSVTLPGSGTYFVEVLPRIGDTGNVRLSLSKNNPDSTIAVNGGAVTFSATHPGQGRRYSFTASAGESIDLTSTGGTYPTDCDVLMAIVDSYGRTLAGPGCAGNSGSLLNVKMPGTGSYLVEIIPADGNTGTLQLQLTDGT